jgi:CheY-like chemotaxis protein
MESQPRILLLDDEPDLLAMYREVLAQLPSKPEIRTASSGAQALAILDAEPFRILITDLKMPKMDGLQVLSVVRRKHPQLRTVVLTSVVDEQFRSRVYALGVDLFWQKPGTDDEIKLFLACLESLLGRDAESGFRGLQNKSLVDLIQLECISQSSVVLRITNGALNGRIWITGGDLVDAETGDTTGESAFEKIMAWKAGTFESLPAEPARPRTIFKSYNALLLEIVQTMDETRASDAERAETDPTDADLPADAPTPLATVAQLPGVEFVLALKSAGKIEHRGLENPEPKARWARETLGHFRNLADRLSAGPLQQIEGLGLQRHITLAPAGAEELAVGWQPSLTASEIADRTQKAVASWAS